MEKENPALQFTEADFDLVSQCIHVAFKAEVNVVPLEEAIRKGMAMDLLKSKLKALVKSEVKK